MPLNPYAAQCTALSKRSGARCKNPAVRGYTVCRMHGARGGAPKGNLNALKHGNETQVFRAYRALNRELWHRNFNEALTLLVYGRKHNLHPDDIPGYRDNRKEAKVLMHFIKLLEVEVHRILEDGKKSEKVRKSGEKSDTTPCKANLIDVRLLHRIAHWRGLYADLLLLAQSVEQTDIFLDDIGELAPMTEKRTIPLREGMVGKGPDRTLQL